MYIYIYIYTRIHTYISINVARLLSPSRAEGTAADVDGPSDDNKSVQSYTYTLYPDTIKNTYIFILSVLVNIYFPYSTLSANSVK